VNENQQPPRHADSIESTRKMIDSLQWNLRLNVVLFLVNAVFAITSTVPFMKFVSAVAAALTALVIGAYQIRIARRKRHLSDLLDANGRNPNSPYNVAPLNPGMTNNPQRSNGHVRGFHCMIPREVKTSGTPLSFQRLPPQTTAT